jgi:N-acylneuraminate cytidylyltransferase
LRGETIMDIRPILAVIPARGGSKAFPGKNLASFAGLPLIAHSIRMAKMSAEIDECVVSTDCEGIARVARSHGGEVPFVRPRELAQDATPMWPVLQHALSTMEALRNRRFGSVLLLQPTNPSRLPEDVTSAVAILNSDPNAMGVVSVSQPAFNPRWVCVEEKQGYLSRVFNDVSFHRRQDVPTVYRINGLLYLWRREHILNSSLDFWTAPHRMLVVPEERVVDIDNAHDMSVGEALIREGLIKLPWLSYGGGIQRSWV